MIGSSEKKDMIGDKIQLEVNSMRNLGFHIYKYYQNGMLCKKTPKIEIAFSSITP